MIKHRPLYLRHCLQRLLPLLVVIISPAVVGLLIPINSNAQDTVTGAFEGTVRNSLTGDPVPRATIVFINQSSNISVTKRADSEGRFYQGLLPPGVYTIRASAPGYTPQETVMRLLGLRTGEVVPVPITLEPNGSATTTTPIPSSTQPPSTSPGPTPSPASTPPLTSGGTTAEDTYLRGQINTVDAQRSGAFTAAEINSLPLGGTTLTRTFDELALLVPGVALPPQPLSSGSGTVGPGVGAGVGTSGQFAVNGLRSRANNFTVDGSDNNDENIGVRRQGFVALVPQPIESIEEYQIITLLAPAQFGRNIGGQVNAISKSGGSDTHGTLYGFFNSSQLNARNYFDTTFGNATMPLQTATGQPVIVASNVTFNNLTNRYEAVNGQPLTVSNQSGGKDSFTLAQGGGVLGGAIVPHKLFYFLSAEGQLIHATQEESFAVPTIEQRGAFETGASGIFLDPTNPARPVFALPASTGGNAIFSLFPFPNNPQGVYGPNTFTQALPASGQGAILSGKIDDDFKYHGREQSFTARYNFTQDSRSIPSTDGALFSTLRPHVRTQNISLFLNSELSAPDSARLIFNQIRLSYGRTRLNFEEQRDTTYEVKSKLFPNTPFLINAPLFSNLTLPAAPGVANTGPALLLNTGLTAEDVLGPVGEINIGGFSRIGTDIYNFPQRRVDNTYQLADQLTLRTGAHNFIFGADTRRTELNSDLPRNFRPLISFYGEAGLSRDANGALVINNNFSDPVELAAGGAASGFFQTLTAGSDAAINLRFYQLDFYAQDAWRVRPNLSLSYGLRYEYNTPAEEAHHRIESSFNDPALSLVPGLNHFLDGRTSIYDADPTDFAPRVGVAYAPNLFGADHFTVLRVGYGIYYDQILGAVVSQSRNVFPRFLTVNLSGGLGNMNFNFAQPTVPLGLLNPLQIPTLVRPGTLNTLNPDFTLAQQIALVNTLASAGGLLPSASGVEATLPSRRLKMPSAQQYTIGVDQQLTRNTFISIAYVGTLGRHLLLFTTPNLGTSAVPLLYSFGVDTRFQPQFFGIAVAPGTSVSSTGTFVGGRPEPSVGGLQIFETSGNSHYDALQASLRGRLRHNVQYQVNYTFGKAIDDVSDVFDLAGAPALPQDSLNRAAERAVSNFDVRHRLAYEATYELPDFPKEEKLLHAAFSGLQLSTTGQFQTGQPFTVNTYVDVNLDGNITDRLNTTQGLVITGDRRQPLLLTTDPNNMRAPVGQDGQIGRNTFRAGSTLELNLALTKNFSLGEHQRLSFRTEVFNFPNRANFGIPVRILESPSFGQATTTTTPARRIQFALKYYF